MLSLFWKTTSFSSANHTCPSVLWKNLISKFFTMATWHFFEKFVVTLFWFKPLRCSELRMFCFDFTVIILNSALVIGRKSSHFPKNHMKKPKSRQVLGFSFFSLKDTWSPQKWFYQNNCQKKMKNMCENERPLLFLWV